MNNNRAVFVDRDGTLAHDVPYCSTPDDFELLPGAAEAVRRLNETGFKVVIVTNQSGVARGYFDEKTLGHIHERMVSDLATENAKVDAIYYCPHHPDDACDCRKPKPTLFKKAAQEMQIDLTRSFMVGDMASDIQAGQASGCRTVLVTGLGTSSAALLKVKPSYVATSLAEAVDWMLGT